MSTEQHQLAAILFTDIVGYTALMQTDEDKAMTLIRRYHEVLDICIGNHHGKIANNYGDGSLCIFPSAINAVNAAIAIQLALRQDPIVPLRIGLHIGEVFFEEGRIFGDGVNVASRIQSMGQANTILFSREIFDKIKNHSEFKCLSLGTFEFKNVDTPIEVFGLANPGFVLPDKNKLEGKFKSRETVLRKYKWLFIAVGLAILSVLLYAIVFKKNGFTGSEKSIAVIPFSSIDTQDFDKNFSYVLQENIANLLSRIGTLKVMATNAARQFRGSTASVKDISLALNNPAALINGSISRLGKDITIHVELIDANSGQLLWGNNYPFNNESKDFAAIQTKVAAQVAKELDIQLNPEQKKLIEREPTNNKDAYNDYLRGKEFQIRSATQGENEHFETDAAYYFSLATKKDSSFSQAWLGLAEVCNYAHSMDNSRVDLVSKGLQAVFKTLQIEPLNSDAYAVEADLLKKLTLNPILALDVTDVAIRLNPNNPKAYIYKAYALLERGWFEEAKKNIEKAIQLDPANFVAGFDNWEYYSIVTGDTSKLKELIGKYSNTSYQWNDLNKLVYWQYSGQFDSLLTSAIKVNDTMSMIKAYMGLKQKDKAISLANKVFVGQSSTPLRDPYMIAQCYALLNDKAKTLEFLEKASIFRSNGIITIRSDREFDPYRNEPRFRQVVEKWGGE